MSTVTAFQAKTRFGELLDRVARNGPLYRYPARPLLGITDADAQALLALLKERLLTAT